MRARRQGDMLVYFCPGCRQEHAVPVVGKPIWAWNGSLTAPSLTPSVRHMKSNDTSFCHYHLTNGVMQYCADCDHAYASQQVPLPDLPDRAGPEEGGAA